MMKMPLSSILTVLDKPKDRPIAFERSSELATRSGATLESVAFTWHPLCDSGELFDRAERTTMRNRLKRTRQCEARRTLEALCSQGARTPLRTVWTDDIAGWIAKELNETPRDLVVKTVHRSKSVLHTPLDWELLRRCPAPVLLAAESNRQRTGVILAAVDLRHDDAKHRRLNARVVNAAQRFAELYGGRIHVVAVTPMSQVLHDLEIIDERALSKRVKTATKPQLDRLLAPLDVSRDNVHQPLGKVGPTVGRLSSRLKADLLVVGSSAHRLRQAIGLGSSAEQILQHAVCDVLAVHP